MMVKAFVFLVTMLLPDGSMITESSVHNACPNQEVIMDLYTGKQATGEVVDWQAGCFEVQLKAYVGT